jgi:anaerobic magnesium-protoporphyrin IX monomethyl ester cyclase
MDRNMVAVSRIALIAFENEIAWGLRNIAEYLRFNGFNASLYFLERYANKPRGVPVETIDKFMEVFSPMPDDVVGISFMTPYREYAKHLAEKVRAKGALVLVGGTHPTILPDDCKPFTDYIIRGAGEDAMLNLLEYLREGNPPEKGVFQKENDYWFNEDVNKFPYPRYGDIEDKIIVAGHLERTCEVPRRLGLITRYQTFTSFGCPYGCTYCVNPILQQLSGRRGKNYLRRRNAEHVIAELHHVKGRIDLVSFEDEDFLIDTEHVTIFLEQYKKEIGLPFSCLVTPTTLHSENLERIVRMLSNTGCISITIGLQSASPHTTKLFQRSFDPNWFQQVACMFARYGIFTTYDVILNNPFEDDTDVAQTINTVLNLPRPLEFNIFYLTFFPGYILTQKAQEQGFVIDGNGNTRLNQQDYISIEEYTIRLAQVPFIPRNLLRFLYKHHTTAWSKLIISVLGRIITLIWKYRWISMTYIGVTHPEFALSLLKKLRDQISRKKVTDQLSNPASEERHYGKSNIDYTPSISRPDLIGFWQKHDHALELNNNPSKVTLSHDLFRGMPVWFNAYYAFFQKRTVMGLIRKCNLQQGSRSLDIGCGTGRWSSILKKMGLLSFGMDIGEHAVRFAAKQLNSALFSCGMLPYLAFAKESFDLVLSVTVVQHIPRQWQPKTILEISSVLKPGGCLVICESIDISDPSAHVFGNSLDRWINMFQRAGLELITRSSCEYLPHVKIFHWARLLWQEKTNNRYPQTNVTQVAQLIKSKPFFAAFVRLGIIVSYPLEYLASWILPERFGRLTCFLLRKR